MGFGVSRSEARQLVRHKGVMVNGVCSNIPSRQLKDNDSVELTTKAKEQLRVKAALDAANQRGLPEWLDVDTNNMKGIFKSVPDRTELPSEINESLVVALYSK